MRHLGHGPARFVAALGVLLAASAARADDVDLTLKLAKGKAWKVDQTVELISDAPPAARTTGGAVVAVGTLDPYALKESWSDSCVKDEGGKPDQVQRTYTSSKIAPAKKSASPTGLEGAVLSLTATDPKCTVKADKGKPEALALKLLERGPIDLVGLLLPNQPVAEGGGWEVQAAAVGDFQMVASAGVAAARGAAAKDLQKDIEKLGEDDFAATSAAMIVKAELASVKDGVATIQYTGKLDTREMMKGQPMPNVPHTVTEIAGTLTFNVKTGQPVKLTWSQKHTAEAQDIAGPAVGKGQIPGMSEEWKLTRTWAAK